MLEEEITIDSWEVVMTDTEGKKHVLDMSLFTHTCEVIDDMITVQYEHTWGEKDK